MNGQKIEALGNPVALTDAVNKQYVDSVVVSGNAALIRNSVVNTS
jgi:hypothetical protein